MSFDMSQEALIERIGGTIIPKRSDDKFGYTVLENGWVHGTWYCGTGFQKSKFYGQFPRTFVDRITTWFPTGETRFLHLCCGGCNIPGAMNVDKIQENVSPGGQPNVRVADIYADAEALPQDKFPENSYDVCLIDPPYTTEDATTRYGLSRLVRPSLVFNELYRIIPVGGWVIWFDEKTPQISTKQWDLCGLISVVKGRNRRWVGLSMFRKLDAGDWRQYKKENEKAEFDTENSTFEEGGMTIELNTESKVKRIKRTQEEIAAGLTIEEVRLVRETKTAVAPVSLVPNAMPASILNQYERLAQRIEEKKKELSALEQKKLQLDSILQGV